MAVSYVAGFGVPGRDRVPDAVARDDRHGEVAALVDTFDRGACAGAQVEGSVVAQQEDLVAGLKLADACHRSRFATPGR